ncbi:MAG TPA: twin-arginine translocase TatA/TatE family subunit [Solirubrobacteraceae bacterium]|jgi:sec-independent protein translocase protein TatA|nr:twin-arginine translocase TatA/TatE family subunit [Solirubrobacteraceae bacterium]
MGLDNPSHILLLFLLVLLVFGARRLPEIGRSLGTGLREFKQSVTGESHTPATQQTLPPAPAQPSQQPPAPAPASQQPAQQEAAPTAQQAGSNAQQSATQPQDAFAQREPATAAEHESTG